MRRTHALRYLLVLACEVSLVLLPIWIAFAVRIAWPEDLNIQLVGLAGATVGLILLMLAGAHVWERIREARRQSETRRSAQEGARVGYVETTWRRRFWIDPSQTTETEKTLESYLAYWASHANARMRPRMDWVMGSDGKVQEVRASSLPDQLIRPTETGLRTLLLSLAVRNSGCVRMTMTADATGTENAEPTDVGSALRAASDRELISIDVEIA